MTYRDRNLAHAQGPSGYRIVIIERRKYINVDEKPTFEGEDCPGQSGRFMVDRATGEVFTIKGYGQRGQRIGTLEALAAQYRAASATYHPAARAFSETRGSRCARWHTPKQPQLTLIKGGRS